MAARWRGEGTKLLASEPETPDAPTPLITGAAVSGGLVVAEVLLDQAEFPAALVARTR